MRECKTEKQVGEILGISRDCVHDRILKGKRRFKKLIKQYRKEGI